MTVNLLAQTTLLVTSPTKAIVEFPEQLSAAVTLPTFASGIADAQVNVTFAGQLAVGATLSLTVMICVQIAVLLHKSAAR